MKRQIVATMVAVVVVGLSGVNKNAWGAVEYTVTDLGTLPGGSESYAFGINNNGQVVGEAETASGVQHAFLYSNGTMTDLNNLIPTPYNYESAATGINDSGQVVGSSVTTGNVNRAFLYSNGTMTDLGTLPAPFNYESVAGGINASGQVVGYTENAETSACRTFLYGNGTMSNLGTLPAPFNTGSVGMPSTITGRWWAAVKTQAVGVQLFSTAMGP